MNQIDLAHRTAIVTGGAQGLGLSIAHRLLQSGASVALWDFDQVMLAQALEDLSSFDSVSGEVVDVSDPIRVSQAFAASRERHGAIDILVANAGIAGPNHPTWEYPIEDWQRVIQVNLLSIFYCCRSVIPHMIERNYGRIVNVASIAGKEGNPNASAYSASKAAVIALTKSLGKETAAHNIAVNCVTPAAARTRIFDQMSKEHIDYMLSRIPRARFLEVDEASAMISWLVSEENSFTTGAVFDLSGGRATY